MSKQVRLSGDVAARVDVRALVERRSFANMVEVLLLAALEGNSAVLTEREPTPMRPRDSRAEYSGERVAGRSSVGDLEGPVSRSVSIAAVPPLVQNQPMEKMARDLAVVGGKCAADVAWGTKCKLCGKVHG